MQHALRLTPERITEPTAELGHDVSMGDQSRSRRSAQLPIRDASHSHSASSWHTCTAYCRCRCAHGVRISSEVLGRPRW